MFSVRFAEVVKRIRTVSNNAEREAMWILEASCGLRQHHLRTTLSKDDDLATVLNNRQLATFLANVDDRVDKRKPLQYICSDTYFCNLHLKTRPPVLIPRPETEQMVSWLTAQVKTYNEATSAEAPLGTGEKIHIEDVIDGEKVGKLGKYPVHKFRYAWYNSVIDPLARQPAEDSNPNHRNRPLWNQLNKLRFLDICTGSGNIALSLAGQFPESESVGIDIDSDALALAKDNAAHCGFPNVSFYPCDVFRPPTTVGSVSISSQSRFDGATEYSLYDLPIITGLYDIIVSNPPYVFSEQLPHLQPEVREWESSHALTPAPRSYGAGTGMVPDFARADRWPSPEEVKRLALPFYEKIVKMSPRLLNKTFHNQTLSHVRFPRLVMEIGDEEQVLPICNMINELMDAEVYLDSEEKCRWIVGFERS